MSARETVKYYYFLTLISPVLGAYLAIRNLSWRWRKSILIFVITLFGATIILQTSDGFVLRERIYEHYVGLSFGQWLFELKQMLLFSPEPGTKGDVYSHLSSYLVGQILGIPAQYFVFVSFVYAYFYIGALSKILLWDRTFPKSSLFWVIIIIFVTYRFVDSLQTVRTWTGLWVLFNGVYGYHQTGKIKYLLLMLAAPLFHVAYFAMALPAYAVIFIKRLTPKFFIIAYLLSFLVTINPSGIIEKLKTTDLGEDKVAGYYREDHGDPSDSSTQDAARFYKTYGNGWALPNAPHVLASSLLLMGLFSKRRMNRLEIGMFSTGILMATMANFGDFVPAFYNRTMVNAGIYITATTVLLLLRGELLHSKVPFWRKSLLWISAAAFSPYLVYVLANILQFTSIFMMIAPIAGFFEEFNMSLREFIGFLFL